MSDPVSLEPRKRLIRPQQDKMIAGVCAGIADYFGMDVTMVRLLVVVGTILGLGSLVIAYIIAWILIPQV
ncbi:MAG TPA: PspC domain-containing protein [Nocardioidaceae bacterium]|jgi:phage shock protein PspC (stress-responsive transcriptional regulator)|nr:PspC domain-containing protein [Actinomycetota bacterium]HEV8056773.1 PspC domain-containing protein [Nocardioidaceae bacterium]